MARESTFSIVARDAATGDLGVAVASKFLAAGATVPYAEVGVGILATQSRAHTRHGPRAMAALKAGVPLDQIGEVLAQEDPLFDHRQFGIIDAKGSSLTHTGPSCPAWAGGERGMGYAAQGNLLVGPHVIRRMCQAFESARGPLYSRLLEALEAGDAVGGDRRGRQSAALIVYRERPSYAAYGEPSDRDVNLRVDDHPAPIPELWRLLAVRELLYSNPLETDALPLVGEVLARTQAVLARSGRIETPREGWNQAANEALLGLLNTDGRVEGLRDRFRLDGKIDRLVLNYLERRYRE